MNFANFSIRQVIAQRKLTFKGIASFMGVSREYLSRCMSKPLNPDMSKKVLAAIDALSVSSTREGKL